MKKQIIILVSILGVFLLATYVLSFSKKTVPFPLFQIPTPTPVSITTFLGNNIDSPLEKTVINTTTQKDVEKIPNITTSPSSDGTTTYALPSVNVLVPDEIQTQNGLVMYERTSLFTNQPGGFPSLSAYLKTLGTPQQIIQGNRNYGQGINAYLFPGHGVVLIGNPATDETYEIQRFSPMSVLDYLRRYGDSVKQTPDNGGETGVSQ